VIGVLLMLAYSIVAFGPEGYPIDMMLGGLLGAYGGFDQLKRRQAQQRNGTTATADAAESLPPPSGAP
jgi:hypothetical protein